MTRQKTTFAERLPLILAFFLPILIMLGIFAGKGLYPFGINCFLRTDLYHQYVAFFENFAERLREGRSLTYAFDIGIGSNYTALFAYYLCGPLHFLAVLVPKGWIIEFITGLIVLKIGACGWSMAWFLSKKFNTRHFGIAFCGICYSLSGYLAAYSWNIMWLDVLVLTPLVLLGLEKLMKEGKPFLYCITLALSILCNYYIAIMLCMFLVLYFLTRLIAEPLTSRAMLVRILQFGFYSLLAGGLAAVLLVPAAYSLQITASANTTFPKTITNYFSFFEMISRHLAVVDVETGLDHWPNLYCGAGIFLLLPLYYMNKDVPFKDKIVNTCLLAFLLLSFNTNMLNYIWHGFHYPNSLPCRQSFLYNLVMLMMCFEGLRGLPKLSRGKLLGSMWGGLALVFLVEVIADKNEVKYYAVYATAVFIALYTLAAYLHKAKKLTRTGAVTMAVCVLVVEMGLNTAVTSVSYVRRTDFTRYDDAYETLIKEGEEGKAFVRMERINLRTKNDGPYFGYTGASLFSSTTNAAVTNFYKKLGMEGNTNAYCYSGGTVLTASMLSIGYRISERKLTESPLYTLVDTAKDRSNGTVYLYKMNYTLPLGYLVPDDTDTFWNLAAGNPAKVQNSFVNITTNVSNILTQVSATISDKTISYTAEQDGWYYVYVTNTSVNKVTATVNSFSRTWDNVNRGYFVDMGYCLAGDKMSVATKDDLKMNGMVYRLNTDNFIQAFEVLNSHPMTDIQVTDTVTKTAVSGTVTADKPSTLLISLPYEKGWTATVDGKPAEIGKIGGALIAIDVTEGTHTVEIRYQPEGLVLGVQLSLISLCLLLISAIVSMLIRTIRERRESLAEESEAVPAAPAGSVKDRLLRIRQKDDADRERERRQADDDTEEPLPEISLTEEVPAGTPQEEVPADTAPADEAPADTQSVTEGTVPEAAEPAPEAPAEEAEAAGETPDVPDREAPEEEAPAEKKEEI